MVSGRWIPDLGDVVHTCHHLPFTHFNLSLPIVDVMQLPRQKANSPKKDVKVPHAGIVLNLRPLR